jgi:hypothetical protein
MNLPEPISQGALAFFQALLGPVGEASEILTDKVRFYRWQTGLRTLEKARKLALKKKLKPEEVPLKFLVPFLEAASLEEVGSDLEDYWAQLLTGAIQEKRLAKNVFIDVLKNSTSDEIKVLDWLVDKKLVKLIRKAPGWNEVKPAMLLNALMTMRRIQLADHVEKSVLYIIDHFEEDLSANAEQVNEFLMALASHDHTPVRIENIIISDRGGAHSYSYEDGDLKSRWRKTLENETLFGPNIEIVDKRGELDSLVAKGLVDRTFHTFDAYDGHGLFSLICPTPLGIEFVCACRGKPLPYPKEEK